MSHHINTQNVFIIIPAYNENTIIRSVVLQLLPYRYKVVVVEDGSSVSLYGPLKKLPVYFLRLPTNLGQGAALQTGIEFALSQQAQYIITFDADGKHDTDDIRKLTQTLVTRNLDMVLGSRFMRGAIHNMTVKHKVLLYVARHLNHFFSGLLLTDAHNGLRAMTSTAAWAIQVTVNRMAHATEILSQIKKTSSIMLKSQ